MEPKFKFPLQYSCIFFLTLLNTFLFISHANSRHQSALHFLKPMIGTQKGNTTKGLSQLKKYLSNLGYMNNNDNEASNHENNDFFDDALDLAIRKYQKFVQLPITGRLDTKTIKQLQQGRCAVPDFFKDDNRRIINMSSKYSFFPGEPKWPQGIHELTYSFTKGTRPDVNPAIAEATEQWHGASPFRFTYTPDYNLADIKITFEFRDHGDGSPFDGPGGTLAHAFAPTDGRLHFDGDEMWRDGIFEGAYDIQTIGLHELGHILGLSHSKVKKAIMWPYFEKNFRKSIKHDDIDGLKALYKW